MTPQERIEEIRRAYAVLGNHRAVARMLRLPLHCVMYSLGIMSTELYNRVNGNFS